MDERTLPPPPPAAGTEYCYRHPDVATGVHCTRCARPICPDCMVPAPVGYQCPTCVGDARRDYRRGPGRQVAVANAKGVSLTMVTLIVLFAVFVFEIVRGGSEMLVNPSGQALFDLGASQGYAIAYGEWWRMVSAIFLHAGVLHLLLNAWGLYLFGTVVERQTYGRVRFVVIFLVSGFIGNVVSFVIGSPASPQEVFVPGVGASGAIFGMVGAVFVYAFLRRGTPIGRTYLNWAITIIVLNVVIGQSVGGIDNLAHLGGAVGGALCAVSAELLGRRGRAPALEWLGYAAIVAAGVVLTIQHASAIRDAFPPGLL